MNVKNNKTMWSKFGSPSNNSAKLLIEPMSSSTILLRDNRANGDNIAFDDYSFDAVSAAKSSKTTTMSLALEVHIQNKWYSA